MRATALFTSLQSTDSKRSITKQKVQIRTGLTIS